MQAGSLPRRLHLLTELIKLLLLQLRHDSVESIDLNRETDTLAMKAVVPMLELYQEGPGGQGLRRAAMRQGLGRYGWYLTATREQHRSVLGTSGVLMWGIHRGAGSQKKTMSGPQSHSRESGFSPAGSSKHQTLVCRDNLTICALEKMTGGQLGWWWKEGLSSLKSREEAVGTRPGAGHVLGRKSWKHSDPNMNAMTCT